MTLGARLSWLVPPAIAAVACVPFLPNLHSVFLHWGDDVPPLANPHYRGRGRTRLRWMVTTLLLGHYIPLTWLTLAGVGREAGAAAPIAEAAQFDSGPTAPSSKPRR